MSDSSTLFRPFTSANLQLPNRIVMAPMTRNMAPGGKVNDKMVEYYRRRAAEGVGLIITEGVCINHVAASGYPDVPFIGREDTTEGWKLLVDAVHAEGGKIAPQLWHVGAIRRPGVEPGGDQPGYGPSGMVTTGKKTGHVMTVDDIKETVKSYVQAALAAKEIGFDALEIHGAHGYLIDQFFWSGTNVRDDEYGGSLEKRSRFAIEVIQAIRDAVGPNFPILFRFSQWKQQEYTARLVESAEELARFVEPLSEAGVDIFHCSTRRFWEPEFEGSALNLAGWVKKITGKPAIAVGSIGLENDFLPSSKNEQFSNSGTTNVDELVTRMQAEEFDLAAVGRALIANPDWVQKVRGNAYDELVGFDKSMLMQLT